MRELTLVIILSIAVTLALQNSSIADSDISASSAAQLNSDPLTIERRYGGSRVYVTVNASSSWKVSRQDLIYWVDDAAQSLIAYYGRFPIERTLIEVNQTADRGVGFATARYNDSMNRGEIEIDLGKLTRPEDLRDTWTLTHEMVHLAFPHLFHRYKWLGEGVATYVEPIGRYRQGLIAREDIWKELVDNLPYGQPQFGDRGLDRTHSWSRVYWGGALYCLCADVEIRKRTRNRYGLEDALRRIMVKGKTSKSEVMGAPELLEMADRSIGVNVLTALYKQMSQRSVRVDLDGVWKDLGVHVCTDGSIMLDDSAPLAHIRKAIENRS